MTMMTSLITAGVRLAEALREENEALERLDLRRAVPLADAKMRASDAFAAAYAAVNKTGARAEGTVRDTAAELSNRLRGLSEENRRLLERAIALQSRVIETIAGAALPRARPTTYGQAGGRVAPRVAAPIAFSARA